MDKVEVETEKDSDRLEAKIDALTASIALISKSATEQAIINQFTAKMLDQMNKRIEDHERLINDNRSIFEAIIKLIEKFTASKS